MRRAPVFALFLALAAVAFPEEPSFREVTERSEAASRRGLEWLYKGVNADGGWGADQGQPSEPGHTAVVGLTLMSSGNTPTKGPKAALVRRALAYTIQAVDRLRGNSIAPGGSQIQNKIGRMGDNFFAALFLSQVVGESDDPRAERALRRLTDVTAATQQAGGGWGQEAWAPMLGNVMGWVSLRGATAAGVKVRASAERTADHIVGQMRNMQLGGDRGNWMFDLYKSASGIRVLHSMKKGDDPIARKAFEDVLRLVNQSNQAFTQAGGEEYLSFHLLTETMIQRGGKDWARWYPAVRDKLVAAQNADGSWTGHHCITSRTFCTAMSVSVLQAPNRFMPITEY